MCQLTIIPTAAADEQEWNFIPACADVESPKAPSTPSVKRNVFTVSNTKATSKAATLRTDIDMRKQRRVIVNYRRKANEKAVAKDWAATCASRQDHAKFIQMLLAEARHYQLENGDSRSPLLGDSTSSLMKRCAERMERSQSDQYVSCLEMISAKRLFEVSPIAA